MPNLSAVVACEGRAASVFARSSPIAPPPGAPRARRRSRPRSRLAWLFGWPVLLELLGAPSRADIAVAPPSDREGSAASGGASAPAAEIGVGAPVAARPSSPYSSVVRAAASRSAPAEDLTASASVVRPGDGPRVGADLATLLTDVPGANLTRRGGLGSFATLSLRGSNPDEVRVYIDGVPINQAAGGAVDLSTLPIGDVERIEVYRGATPIAFGESALGGVVSISTRAPAADGLTGQAGLGSFGTRFGDVTASWVAGPLRLYAGGHAIVAAGDYPVEPVASTVPSPGSRQNNDLTQLDGTLRAVLALPGRRELRLGFLGFTRDQGLPAEEMYRSVAARAQSTRTVLHAGYESRSDLGASSRLRAVVFASSTRDRFLDPLAEIGGVPAATNDVTRSLGFSATAHKFVGEDARLATVLEGRVETYRPRNDASPGMPAGYPADREVGTVGLELDLRVAPLDLHVIPSGRLEAARDVRSGRDETFGTDLPTSAPVARAWPVLRFGLLRRIGSDLVVRASAGRYQRIPSFLELYGYNRGFVGNAGLRPERGLNLDAGFALCRALASGELSLSGALFGARAEDLISWETYSYRTRAENVSEARVLGAEGEVRARAGRLETTGQITLTDARDEGELASRRGRQLAHHPRYRGYLRVSWRQPLRLAGGPAVSLYADADGTAGNSWTTSAYGALPPRLLGGAGLAVELPRWSSRIAASVYNLLDARAHDFPGYPLPGRSYIVTVAMNLPGSSSDPRPSVASRPPSPDSPQPGELAP